MQDVALSKRVRVSLLSGEAPSASAARAWHHTAHCPCGAWARAAMQPSQAYTAASPSAGDAHVGGVGRLYSRPKRRPIASDPLYMPQVRAKVLQASWLACGLTGSAAGRGGVVTRCSVAPTAAWRMNTRLLIAAGCALVWLRCAADHLLCHHERAAAPRRGVDAHAHQPRAQCGQADAREDGGCGGGGMSRLWRTLRAPASRVLTVCDCVHVQPMPAGARLLPKAPSH